MVAGFLISFPETIFAAVSQIGFATSSAVNLEAETIGQITVQTQDASGIGIKANETIYLSFSVDTGAQISASSTNWIPLNPLPDNFSTSSIFISSSTINKNLYFKGLSDGNYRVIVRGRSKSGITYGPVSMTILVGATSNDGGAGTSTGTTTDSGSSTSTSDTGDTNNSGTNSTTTTNTNTSTKTITRTVYISAHSDPEELSDYNEKNALITSAGRERIAYVGAPIIFSANYKLAKNSPDEWTLFDWSFGDGFKDSGKKVEHTYKYPGDYNVVLNTNAGTDHAVSRTKVTVLVPHITFSRSGDDLTITNTGTIEINLGGWQLRSGPSGFIFAGDTIIGAGKNMTLSLADANLQNNSGSVALLNPSGKEVVETNTSTDSPAKITSQDSVEGMRGMSIEKAERITSVYREYQAEHPMYSSVEKPLIEAATEDQKILQTAAVFESSTTTKKEGSLISRIFGAPARAIHAFFSLFYRL